MSAGIRVRSGPLHFERISNPARSIARGPRGTVIATFTDGARTAVLTGPSKTFAEPRTTDAEVVTESWVRLLPRAWARGAERSDWFRTWLRSRLGGRDPDILATAFDYVAGAPARTTAAGVKYRGAARYTPDTTSGSGRAGQGKSKPRTGSDFYDYLGIPWTYPDTVTRRPEKDPRVLRRQLRLCPAGVRIPLRVPAEQQGQHLGEAGGDAVAERGAQLGGGEVGGDESGEQVLVPVVDEPVGELLGPLAGLGRAEVVQE